MGQKTREKFASVWHRTPTLFLRSGFLDSDASPWRCLVWVRWLLLLTNSQLPPGRRGPSQWEAAGDPAQQRGGISLGAGCAGRLESSELKGERRTLKGRRALPAAGRGPAVAVAEEHRALARRQDTEMEASQ